MACNARSMLGLAYVFRVDDIMTSPHEGYSRSNVTHQSSKSSLFTNFEDVEVFIAIADIYY